MIAQLLLDLVMIGLLSATVGYCIALSRKINQLRANKKELGDFIGEFHTAITQAEENIGQLKMLGAQTDAKLRHHIEKARLLSNDLSFLTDRGEGVASALENHIRSSRTLRRDAISPTAKQPEEMSLAKKLALEEVLKQIAERKVEAHNPSLTARRRASSPSNTEKPGKKPAAQSFRDGSVFNAQRLTNLMKITTP